MPSVLQQFTTLLWPSLPACSGPWDKPEVRGKKAFHAFFAHVPLPAHMYSFLDLQEYVRAFQSPLWTSYSPLFPLKYYGQTFVCPQLVLLPHVAAMLSNCHWFSTNTLKIGPFPLSKFWIRYKAIRELLERLKSGNWLGIQLVERLQTHPTPSYGC